MQNRRSALGRVLTTAACAALVLATGSALAADHYPSKPIRLVVPYPAGGCGGADRGDCPHGR